ncbi:MAG: hypothetical protein LQ348_004061 [Seirophora lacunosa]|nr:MAG: hypothetical protein LQ348_004061 [Seirophora lacunosa]
MKKLFHRKKNSAPSSPEQTPSRSQRPGTVNANPSFRTSRYESTAPANLPQSGQFPLKGNNSSVSFQGRRSETYSRGQGTGGIDPSPRPSTSSPYYGTLPPPRVTSSSHGHAASAHPPSDGSPEIHNDGHYQGRQHVPPITPPTQAFSKLSLQPASNQAGHEDFSPRQHRGRSNYAIQQGTGYPSAPIETRSDGGERSSRVPTYDRHQFSRATDRAPRQTTNTTGGYQESYSSLDPNHGRSLLQSPNYGSGDHTVNEGAIHRKRSIPRKEMPNVVQSSEAAHQAIASPLNHGDRTRNDSNYSFAPGHQHEDDYGSRPQLSANSQPGNHASSQKYPQDTRLSAQEIVDRARGNTYDTEVVEKIAPAIVHERVNMDIHHIREERVTKEIHNHEIHHRILPIIDVEVLPPRHFLPVEGGGLVEISGKEVPGRGNNWVIAETASKIPSDQAAPNRNRSFSARKFPGPVGDAMSYITPEGFPRTEQTWVHQPELETGGRDTGQTWPMEFGKATPDKAVHEPPRVSKSAKSKRSRKSIESQSSAMQQPRV